MPPPSFSPRCARCASDLGPGRLSCPACGALVHRARLEELVGWADAARVAGEPSVALGHWREALALLPENAPQRLALEQRMLAARAEVDGAAPMGDAVVDAKRPRRRLAGAAAGVGTLGLALLKGKSLLVLLVGNGKLLLLGLTKLPTLLSMFVFTTWTSGRGVPLAIGIVASIYVHEMGHVAALRRYGIPASAPMFIPGLGAFVRLGSAPIDAHEDARTGLAGPLWGLGAALFAAFLALVFAIPTARTVASLGASINLLNLVPVWQLDGARGIRPLSRAERLSLAALAVVLGVVTQQWMPTIVGVTLAVRALAARESASGDRGAALLFGGLLVAHSVVAMLPVAL